MPFNSPVNLEAYGNQISKLLTEKEKKEKKRKRRKNKDTIDSVRPSAVDICCKGWYTLCAVREGECQPRADSAGWWPWPWPCGASSWPWPCASRRDRARAPQTTAPSTSTPSKGVPRKMLASAQLFLGSSPPHSSFFEALLRTAFL